MDRGGRYGLVYDPQIAWHLSKIERKFHTLIRREIEKQLSHEPETETRNRKPLARPSALGEVWELRFGPNNRFRVFYKTVQEHQQVYILAVGVKMKDRLVVGGEEFDL